VGAAFSPLLVSVRERCVPPLGVSYVWQTKGLREGVFGSVAMIRVTGDFSEVWQGKGLATLSRKVGFWEPGMRRTAGRGRMRCRVEPATSRRSASNHTKHSIDLVIGKLLCRERAKLRAEWREWRGEWRGRAQENGKVKVPTRQTRVWGTQIRFRIYCPGHMADVRRDLLQEAADSLAPLGAGHGA